MEVVEGEVEPVEGDEVVDLKVEVVVGVEVEYRRLSNPVMPSDYISYNIHTLPYFHAFLPMWSREPDRAIIHHFTIIILYRHHVPSGGRNIHYFAQ